MNAILEYYRGNLLQLFSPHAMNQEVSPCYHTCLPVTLSYHRKETPFNDLHAEKTAEVFLVSVFRRYGPLRRPTSSSCGGLRQRTFFALRAKKKLIMLLWPILGIF